ncbi:hypothetical protein LBMAG09_03650 [Actinomycetes bacterium]|nr:hypothetical protein LBMAG09_03650 [Actinomycetes bacterium]
MNFIITKGTPNPDETLAIANILKTRSKKPVASRNTWGKPQLRNELVKNRRYNNGK